MPASVAVSVDANSNVRGLHLHGCTIGVLRSNFVHTLCKSRFKAVLAILRFTSYDLHEEGADGVAGMVQSNQPGQSRS